MKKLYILTLGMLTTVSAMASERQLASVNKIETSKLNAIAELQLIPTAKRAAAQSENISVADIEGAYTLTTTTLLTSGPSELELYISVEDEATGDISLTGLFNDYAVKGNFDAATGTLAIFNNQDLGEDPDGDKLVFYIKGLTDNGYLADGIADVEASIAEYNNGVFTFPMYDIWALGTPEAENLGWWLLTYNNVMTLIDPNFDPNEGWSFYSTGVFEDGWIIPAAGVSPSDYPWTVNIQKKDDIDGLYRIDCPYTAEECPLSGGKDGYIVFSIADPDYVTVLPDFYSGMDNGSSKLYLFNLEGMYEAAGYDKETVMSALGEIENWSYFSDGVANIYNCRFDLQTPCQSLYVWQDSNGQSLVDEMVSKITFDLDPSKVINIAPETMGHVEYYNLQGVRLDRPSKGINIRVADGKATKVISK